MPDTLQSGDHVKVTVFGEDKISGDYTLNTDGLVSLPLAGTIAGRGKSAASLEKAIADRLRQAYLRDPKVTVEILSLRPIYVVGEVEKPGEYAYRSGLDLWRAVALAGGQTYRASTSTVLVRRAGDTEWHEYELAAQHLIDPGDLIRVPERWF